MFTCNVYILSWVGFPIMDFS